MRVTSLIQVSHSDPGRAQGYKEGGIVAPMGPLFLAHEDTPYLGLFLQVREQPCFKEVSKYLALIERNTQLLGNQREKRNKKFLRPPIISSEEAAFFHPPLSLFLFVILFWEECFRWK